MGIVWEKCGKMGWEGLRGKVWQRKKVLSLVLCVAVMLSVMVVGAGAAFSDQSKIKNTEAVDACVALNIIGGYGDNTYRPENNITRAEVCKMICVALNGGKEPTLSVPATPTFKDVRNDANSSWAEKYIESCVAQGIVGGVGNGMFQPSQNVTGSQLAKMLLVALGYKSDIEGFGGNGWDTNVNVTASAKGLYEGLESIDTSVALTRDSAAQMVWNALNAYEVEYKSTLVTNNGQLTTQVDCEDKLVQGIDGFVKITLLEDKYEAATVTGIMADCSWNETSKKYDYSLDVKNTPANANDDVVYSSATDFSDLFGMKVKVVYTTEKKTGDNKVYGIVPKDSNVLVEDIVGNIDDLTDIHEGTTTKVTISDVDYKIDKDITGYYFCNGMIANVNDVVAMTGYNAFTFKGIDNDNNGKLDTVVLYPISVEKVTFVNSTKFATDVTYTTSEELEDVVAYDGMASDDYVVITKAQYTVNDTATIAKAEIVKGKIDGKKTAGDIDSIRVNGVWYEEIADGKITQNNGSTVEMAVVGNYVFNCDTSSESVATSDIVYLEDVAVQETTSGLDAGKKLMGKIVKADGTIAKAEITMIDDLDVVIGNLATTDKDKVAIVSTSQNWAEATNGTNNYKVSVDKLKGGLYTFNMDGEDYELTRVNKDNLAGFKDYSVTATSFDKDDATLGNYNIADDSVVFVKADDEDNTKVITGKTLKTWSDKTFATSKVLTLESSGKFQTVSVAALTIREIPTSGDVQYGYIVADPYTTKDGSTTYWNYTVFVNGKDEEYISKDQAAKGDMISFTMKDEKEIAFEDGFSTEYAAVLAANETRVQLKDSTKTETYKITEDTIIVYVDAEKSEGSFGTSIPLASDADGSNYKANVAYKANTDKEIEVIYVATNGQFGTTTISHSEEGRSV